jgi:transcription initiation factor TFIIIB Brf1 subunit/transcription initiation factor TFIIB
MFVIITTGLNGAKTELCRVERNAEQIAEAARNKRIHIGKKRRTIKQYLNVQVVELEPQSS